MQAPGWAGWAGFFGASSSVRDNQSRELHGKFDTFVHVQAVQARLERLHSDHEPARPGETFRYL
jgi:hypothetical protein